MSEKGSFEHKMEVKIIVLLVENMAAELCRTHSVHVKQNKQKYENLYHTYIIGRRKVNI